MTGKKEVKGKQSNYSPDSEGGCSGGPCRGCNMCLPCDGVVKMKVPEIKMFPLVVSSSKGQGMSYSGFGSFLDGLTRRVEDKKFEYPFGFKRIENDRRSD